MIIIDTDVIIEILDKQSRKGGEALKKIQASNETICITAITLHELLYGLEKYAKPVNGIMHIPVLVYGNDDAVLSSKLELAAERKGTPVRRTDAMIAAVAINKSVLLYTFDRHFRAFQEEGLKMFSSSTP
jgi:predicted nucleic acid-binding protein